MSTEAIMLKAFREKLDAYSKELEILSCDKHEKLKEIKKELDKMMDPFKNGLGTLLCERSDTALKVFAQSLLSIADKGYSPSDRTREIKDTIELYLVQPLAYEFIVRKFLTSECSKK